MEQKNFWIINLLQQCCSKDDDIRVVFRHPFVTNINDKDVIVASDTHSMLIYHADNADLRDYYKKINTAKSPDCNPIVSCFDFTDMKDITIEQLQNALDRVETHIDFEETECPECCGYGEVEWYYEDRNGEVHTENFQCPECCGSGVIKSKEKHEFYDKHTAISIGGELFAPIKIEKMIKILNAIDSKSLTFTTNKTTICIKAGDFDLILMGLYGETSDYNVIKILDK